MGQSPTIISRSGVKKKIDAGAPILFLLSFFSPQADNRQVLSFYLKYAYNLTLLYLFAKKI